MVEAPNDSNRYHISYQNDSQLIRTIQYADSYTVNGATGEITLNSPSSITSNSSGNFPSPGVDALYGKYCKNLYAAPNDVIFINEKATITRVKNSSGDVGYYIDYPTNYVKKVEAIYKPDIHIGPWGYVQSSNRNAYPDSGTQDGYEYEYLGIPFDNAVKGMKTDIGSYVGTGTYGAANPNALTMKFEPKFVIFWQGSIGSSVVDVDSTNPFYWIYNGNKMFPTSSTNNYNCFVTLNGITLTWYSPRNKYAQYNDETKEYHYVAIG